MRRFKALTRKGLPIISVLANNEPSARKRIAEELAKNESRLGAMETWNKGNQMIYDEKKDIAWVKINKSNWSGEEAVVGFHAEKKLLLIPDLDGPFELRRTGEVKEGKYHWIFYEVYGAPGSGFTSEFPLCKVTKDILEDEAVASAYSGEIERSNIDIFIVAAKLLFNII
jgi:hypothetical protein